MSINIDFNTLEGQTTLKEAIKTSYELNNDTNVFTDAQKTYLNNLIAGNGDIRYDSSLNISSDTTLTDLIPAGFILTNMLIEEINSQEVDINIGTTVSGYDVLYDQTIDADDSQVLVFDRFFSKTSDQTIYVNSDDWNGSSINIYIQMTRIY